MFIGAYGNIIAAKNLANGFNNTITKTWIVNKLMQLFSSQLSWYSEPNPKIPSNKKFLNEKENKKLKINTIFKFLLFN